MPGYGVCKKVILEKLLSQVFCAVRPKLLGIIKVELENDYQYGRGFFKHLRTYLRHYPSRVDEYHVIKIVGL